jgi:hypothetical protein
MFGIDQGTFCLIFFFNAWKTAKRTYLQSLKRCFLSRTYASWRPNSFSRDKFDIFSSCFN